MPFYTIDEIHIPDEDAVLWRYQSIAKYLSLLRSHRLYFASLAVVREENDFFEGILKDADYKSFTDKQDAEWYRKAILSDTSKYYINCWYASKPESISMWERYAKNCDGVAIKTTFKNLKQSLIDAVEKVTAGLIRYEDFNEQSESISPLSCALSKRLAFREENELRLLFTPEVFTPEYSFDAEDFSSDQRVAGYSIPVDINILLTDVYVSPFSPSWVVDMLKCCTADEGLHPNVVIHSTINQPPKYT